VLIDIDDRRLLQAVSSAVCAGCSVAAIVGASAVNLVLLLAASLALFAVDVRFIVVAIVLGVAAKFVLVTLAVEVVESSSRITVAEVLPKFVLI